MQINFFTIVSKFFYTLLVFCVFIIYWTYNYVYPHGYEDKGMYFTVPTDYCSFYVGPQARNSVKGGLAVGWSASHHSFYIKNKENRASKYKDVVSVLDEWHWGQFKVEYSYSAMGMFRNVTWTPVSSTEHNMNRSHISCTSSSDILDTKYYGLFNLSNTSGNQKTTTRNMSVTKRTIASNGRIMNFAPLIIGQPRQGGLLASTGDTYFDSGANVTIPQFTIKSDGAMLGHSRTDLSIDPEYDPNFTQLQNELRGDATKFIYFTKYNIKRDYSFFPIVDQYKCNAEDVGGRFKVYAGFLFFHRVQSNINNHGKIQGYYGISASCPIPYKGDVSKLKDSTGFYGTINNKMLGVIIGEKAAIDIDAGSSTYTSIDDVTINNEEESQIYGSIIIPDIQHGVINNRGKIIPNTISTEACTMELKLGGIDQLNNDKISIINTYNLVIGKTNKNSVINNHGMINVGNILSAPKIINHPSGKIIINELSNSVKLYENHGIITVSNETSITYKNNIKTYKDSKINANKTLTIDNRNNGSFDNKGSISVLSAALYLFNFTNVGEISANKILGGYFINNGNVVGLSLSIETSTTNNNSFNIGDFIISNSFKNNKFIKADNLTIATITLNNEGTVLIKDTILTKNNGKFFNDVNARLIHYGENFYFNASKINISNKGYFIVQNNLKLKSNLTTEATFVIDNLFSVNKNKLIKTADSYCHIENFVDGIIENLGDINIKNVVGKTYIDNYAPIVNTIVSTKGEFNIDYLSSGEGKSYIINNGSIIIHNQAELNNTTIANNGSITSIGNTKFLGKFSYLNRGNFTFGKVVTVENPDFVFTHTKAGKKVIFPHSIKTELNIHNQAILQLDQPISLASYKGSFYDDIIINASTQTSSSTAYLSADKISLFSDGSNPRTRMIINVNQIDLKKKQTITLLQSKNIYGLYDVKGQMKNFLYGDMSYISHLTGYSDKDSLEDKKLVLIANNPRIIQTTSNNKQLIIDCQWLYTPKYFYKPDNYGVYSMDYINRLIYGYIALGVNFDIFCDGPIAQWYIDKSKLYIGQANKNLPITNIKLLTSNIRDTFSITALYTSTSIGRIEVLSTIEANNVILQANALAIRTKKAVNERYSHTKLPTDEIYLLDKLYINKNANLKGGLRNKSGLELACLLTGSIENHGFITGYNGINIVGPLNYIDGSISNYGDIIANIAINTQMNIPYDSDKSRKCIITNYKKMQGGFILGGYNCDFINEGSVISTDKGIIGRYSNNNTINNKGDMQVSNINIEESSSTLNLINNGNLSIDKFSVLTNLTNYNYLITKQELGVVNLLSNSGIIITPKINTSDTIQLKYNIITPKATIINSGTIIINTSFKSVTKLTNNSNGVIKIKKNLLLLSDNFTNYGMIYVGENIQMESSNITNQSLLSTSILSIADNLDLGNTGSIYTKQIKSISRMATIKGNGNLFINDKVITFDNNLDINTNKLTINANKIKVASTINITTNELIINNGNNICDIDINPGSELTLKCSNPISKNINLINSGTLELKSVLYSSLTTPLHEITSYTANRGSNLILRLPDLLSKNKEITDLSMPLIKIDKIAKLDKKSTKINIFPVGTILRDTESKITIIQAAALYDENNNRLINADTIINKSFITDNIELILNDIKVENNSITARVNLIDKSRLGPNMRRAKMLVSANLLGKSYLDKDKEFFGIAYTYNHKVDNFKTPVNNASLTSAYTDNLILSPIAVIDYGLNFNAQLLNIKPTTIKEINSILGMPALIIGTTVLPDKFFNNNLDNYITFDSIKLSNIVINGKKDYKQKIVSTDGLVINGSNDLRLQDGIYFDATTKLLAGTSSHALNFACYYVGDILNNGIIGDGVNYSGVHLNQPIEGTLTNNNNIIANVNAIDITTNKSWPLGKGFTIINNGSITGSIEVNCNPDVHANAINIVNHSDIIANKIASNINNIVIKNTARGKLQITGLIKVSSKNLINNGVLDANNLLLESNFISAGNITANYLQGNSYHLTAPYIQVKNIENTSLTANLVTISSLISKKVIVDTTLMISGKVENKGELTAKFLQFATNSNLTNHGSITIKSPIVNLDNSVFNNLGNLEVGDILNLTGDFNTSRGKLLVNTLKLSAHNINASEGAIIQCNHLINTASNSNIVMQKGTVFELGNNIATTTTINGSISFSKVDLSDYMQKKHEATLKLNANLICNNGVLQAGNIITDNIKPIYLTITKKAQVLFSLPIQETKLHVINQGLVGLADDNQLYSYKGENATIEMSLRGQATDITNSLLTTNDQITFNNNSIIRLKPNIEAIPTPYTYTKLFTTPLNNIKYKNSSGSTNIITTDNIVALIDKQENNKIILRLKDIKVTHTATNSIVSAMIGIRNIANFPSYMAYLDQQLHSNLLVDQCCDTTKTIEGIIWAINYKNKLMQSNNLIISPYNLVDTYRVANFNVINKELSLVSPQDKPTYIGVTDNSPAVVIGTEITSTDATQKIIANNNSILAINSIFLDNIIIDGSKKTNSGSRGADGLLITGSNALHLDKFLEIGTNCILKSLDNNHSLHIAAEFKGDINNFGSIGNIDPHIQNAILISQPYSGTITNYNIIQAINTALTVNSEANWNSNNKLNLVNKGEIIGGIIINKSAKAKQDININLINYGNINNYDGDDDNPCKIKHDKKTILNIYNKDNAQIIMHTLVATKIINRGYIFTSELEFNKLNNYGYLILVGTDTFKINDNNFINQGSLHLIPKINLTGNFTNNGTIETISNIDTNNYNLTNKAVIKSKASINTNSFINTTNSIVNAATLNIGSPTGKLTNYGSIFIDSLIQQGTLVNNNYLQINNPVKLTPKIINNGTLEVISTIKLADNYDNNGYIKTNILDGKYLAIINTNSLAKIETLKLQNITIKGSAVITKEITGTVNVTNLYSNTDIYNYSNLTVDSWFNEAGKIINYGSVKINDFKINHVLNYGLLTAKILDTTYNIYGNIQVDNYGRLHADALNECNLNNYNKGYAVFNTIDNSDIINQGTLKVSNSLVNNVIIEGSLQIVTEVQQHGHCQVEFITGDYLRIYGTINASAVNINYIYNEATLTVNNQLTVDTNNKLDNYGYITTEFLNLNGVLFNRRLANLTINKQDSIRLADKNCINYGNITAKNNILIYDNFNCFGSITAATIKVAENAKFTNTGNIYLCYINNNLLSSKRFKNKANITVANDAILQEQFINDGIISANKISSLNQNIKFINNDKSLAKFNIIENIQVVNKGVFSIKNSILGDVSITGCITLGSDITQNGNLLVDNIKAATDITSVNFNIQDNSFCCVSQPLIDKCFDIVNDGCLYLKPKSTINSYVSHGGILKIYLPQDLSTITEPLLSVAHSIKLYDHLNEKPLIVLLANQFTNIRKNQTNQQITILEAKNIFLNKDDIQQSMLADILAVQDASAIDDSLISNSILLHISSSRVKTENKTSIYANVYWEKIKNIKGLLSNPISLTKLAAVLQQEQSILHRKKIFSDIKYNIENNNIPKETCEIVSYLSKTMNVKKLLFLPFPENSSCNQELIISSINEAISSLNKRLTTDRASELYNNQHGINLGSLYQNLYVWSSFSFQKENNYKQSLYPYGDSTSKILNFGIDTQFNRKLKLGFMLANISTIAKTLGKTLNAEYNVTRNYEVKGMLSTVYFSQMFNLCTLNVYLNTAKYKFNQNMNCAFSGKTAYNASLLGVHGEVIYPLSYNNFILEFAELIRINSISLATYNFENKLIHYGYRRNIINIGVSASCYYNIPLTLDSKLYLGCALTYMYNFAPNQQQKIAVSYFDNDFNITQQVINQHDVKVDSSANLTLFNKLKLAVNVGIGFKASSKYLNGKLKLNYSF